MKITSVIAAFAFFGAACVNSEAQEIEHAFFSGNDIYTWCQTAMPVAQAYTAGLWDETARIPFVLNAFGISADAKTALSLAKKMLAGYCEPRGVTVVQVTDVFCAHLRANPEKRTVHASLLFNEAMTKAWPCKK
jgi:hypothetical protein